MTKKASIRELHEKTGRLVQAASEGEHIIIVRRGIPVAELRALSPERSPRGLPNRDAFLAKFPEVPDSSRHISEDRGRE